MAVTLKLHFRTKDRPIFRPVEQCVFYNLENCDTSNLQSVLSHYAEQAEKGNKISIINLAQLESIELEIGYPKSRRDE